MNTDLLKRTFARLKELKGNLSEIALAERRAHHNTIRMAALPEHAYTEEGMTMDDRFVCSCGWKSETFWDGREYAYDTWREHIESQLD
jgi:hypothetical protein